MSLRSTSKHQLRAATIQRQALERAAAENFRLEHGRFLRTKEARKAFAGLPEVPSIRREMFGATE